MNQSSLTGGSLRLHSLKQADVTYKKDPSQGWWDSWGVQLSQAPFVSKCLGGNHIIFATQQVSHTSVCSRTFHYQIFELHEKSNYASKSFVVGAFIAGLWCVAERILFLTFCQSH